MSSDDPRLQQDFGARMSLLIWWPIVEVMVAYNPGFNEIISAHSPSKFPDGTLCFDTTAGMTGAWSSMMPYRESGLEIRQNTIFRSLACFPRREYQLLYTWEYFDRIGSEEDFRVAPIRWCDVVHPNELTAERVPVYMKFWRRPSSDTVAAFHRSLLEWGESVGEEGVFAQQPARLISDSFVSSRRMCSFAIDVSRSTQQTVNWLVLSLLNFGARAWPISEISFAHEI